MVETESGSAPADRCVPLTLFCLSIHNPSLYPSMLEPHGPALLATVTTLMSLGFLMIGYDNGLLGGLGGFHFSHFVCYRGIELSDNQ